jgi:hypothetical protein
MRTNYLLTDTPVIRGENKRRLLPKELARGMKSSIRVSLDDFMKQYSLSTLNEYGERVIIGRRIC